MSEIVLKLPRRRNRVKIIRTPEEIERILSSYSFASSKKKDIPEEQFNVDDLGNIKEVKTTFHHKFVITNENIPLKISLSNIPKPSISVEDAKIEVQSAYDKGFADGQEASNAVYQNEINTYKEWIKNIDSTVKEIKKQFINELKVFEDLLIPTSVMIASHFIAADVENNYSMVIDNVKKALHEVEDELIFKINVNPKDAETLLKVKSQLVTDQSRIANVEIVNDNSITRGGALLYTNAGIIDARIETQLEKIKENLLETMKEHNLNSNEQIYNEIEL